MTTIYQKFIAGDSLTDDELKQGVMEFHQAGEALMKLGPEFQIMRKECNRVQDALEGFLKARGIRQKPAPFIPQPQPRAY